MSEDERLEMLRTATEAHADLKELALRLRRRLPAKAPAPATRSLMSCACGGRRVLATSAESSTSAGKQQTGVSCLQEARWT